MPDFDFDEIDRAVSGASPSGVGGAAPTETPAVRRSSGRFMDMVHPASDMTSQRGAQPRDSAPAIPVPQRPAEVPVPQVPQPSQAQTPQAPQTSQMPTPPAAAAPEPTAPATTTLNSTTPEPATSPTTTPAADSSAVKPLESPFLDGAKVEKRPLGGFEVPPASTSDAPSAPNAQPSTEPSYESSSPSLNEPLKVGELNKPSTQSSETGASFNAGSYNQPFVQVAKKKPGLRVILWILLLVVLGAGAGVAFYVYVLPLL